MSTTTKKTATKKSIAKPCVEKMPQAKPEIKEPAVKAEPGISELGKKLWEIRARIEASGVPLLTMEEIEQEITEQRRNYD